MAHDTFKAGPPARETTAIRSIRKKILLLACTLATLSAPAAGQVNDPAYADYFLVGRFGEICTMCEAIVLCEAGDALTPYERIPADRRMTLYHLQTRTFWSQVSTIWEWFIANFNADALAAGHTRPVKIYTVDHLDWSGPEIVEARVSLDPAEIVIGRQIIDRIDRRWYRDGAGQPVGFCQRLPLWESLSVIESRNRPEDSP